MIDVDEFIPFHALATTSGIMSSPAPAIRDELTAALKERSSHYWETLNAYLIGKIPRVEYEEVIRQAVDTPHLGAYSLCLYSKLNV